MNISAHKVGFEPIPGYVLRKRIGAGGYGEVWLADAPGGLQKAVKLVYGGAEQSQASTELKSLQRIREVTHPFLLSLERIEIVDDQVIIVTELAESSLLDRHDHYVRKGEPGIPRTMLLEFLHDTADGLDFLAQRHSLQHLDVKPGNLLIIADRVKVADFGLVKDLQETNQSLVSGLTPTYSAPEIFDGRPDFRSDQYSLAIVYMEMLTGQLPFVGKTTGELARLHLSQAPDLEALPPADRPVVARALAKNPLDRFASCRQFIEQLQRVRGAAIPVTGRARSSSEAKSTPSAVAGMASGKMSTSVTQKPRFEFQPALPLEPAADYQTPRSLFVGLGGLGCLAVHEVWKKIYEDCDSRLSVEAHGWLLIDTVNKALEKALEEGVGLHEGCAIQMPIYKPTEYRDSDPQLFTPLSRRWLYNIPKSLTTEGVRPLAILTLLDHYEPLKAKLKSTLSDLVEKHQADEQCSEPLRIYLCASLHGGTGSGLISEIGHLIRLVCSELRFHNYRLCATMSLATTPNAHSACMPAAAAMACLSEIGYQMSPGREFEPLHFQERNNGSIQSSPFDWLSLVDGGLHGASSDYERAIENAADGIFVDSQTRLSAVLAEQRTADRNFSLGWLRFLHAAPVDVGTRVEMRVLARWCAEHALAQTCDYLKGTKSPSPNDKDASNSGSGSATFSGDIPLTKEATAEFTARLLRGIGICKEVSTMNQILNDDHGKDFLSGWARRLTSNTGIRSQQLESDLTLWKSTIAKLITNRVYNWKQVEQIQLSVIEGILEYCERETDRLVQIFTPFAKLLGSPKSMRESVVGYLRQFAGECHAFLQYFHRDGNKLAAKVSQWHQSLTAERMQSTKHWDGNVASLPSKMQVLVGRVCAVLNSALHNEIHDILEDAVESLHGSDRNAVPLVPDMLTLSYVIALASDLVPKLAGELGVDPGEFGDANEASDPRRSALSEIDDFKPCLPHAEGKLFRFVVAPQQQIHGVAQSLADRRLTKTTTLIPGTNSMGTYFACEGSRFNLANTLSALFRPIPSTMHLAERLKTRIDIDWPPISALFENVVSEEVSDAAPLVALSGLPSVSNEAPCLPSETNS